MRKEPRALRALLVEDSELDAMLVLAALRRGGFEVSSERVDTESNLREALKRTWDVVFCDYNLPSFDGREAIEIVRTSRPELPVIVVSGTMDEEAMVEALRLGANDYVMKDHLSRLVPSVNAAIRECDLRQSHRSADVSRRQAEAALQDADERFQLIQQVTKDAIWDWNAQTNSVWFNNSFFQTFGYDRADIAGGRDFRTRLIHPEDVERVSRKFDELLEGPSDTLEIEYRFRRKNGEYATVQDRCFVKRDGGKGVVRIAGSMSIVAADLRQEKEAQRKIAEQAALLDQAKDVIVVQDLGGTIQYWNKSAEQVFGWTVEETLGKRVQDLLHHDEEYFESALAEVLREDAWSGEFTKLTKDGDEVLLENRWTLLRDEFGNPTSILSIHTDITERKKLEAQFLRAQRLESIGTLAGGIAHDLNNVLGPIIMAVDLFKLKFTDKRDLELLETVDVSARRGAEMVRQVLSFARGIEGRKSSIRPLQLLKEVAKIAKETFPKSITVSTAGSDDLWNIPGDATQLHQVLLNLCVNSRDAMSEGGRLSLSACNVEVDAQFAATHPDALAGDYVLLTVSDTGVGMPPGVIEKIFEPFFTTKEIGKGTGLGLSTTLSIVQSHHGFIHAESEPNRGTTFKVFLPATVPDQHTAGSADSNENIRGSGETILVIDDESSVRVITRQTLEAFGYRVIVARDGAEGVAAYAQRGQDIAAVLTDMMMPVMDGAATIRALMRINPEVRIIAASGLVSKGAEAEAAGQGVKYFLPKPYTASTLLRTLHFVLHPEHGA